MDPSTRDQAAPASETASTAGDTLKQKSRDSDVISGGRLVAKALKAEGVDTISTLCGDHIIDIYDGCLDAGIRIIDVRHEQVAAHAAAARECFAGACGPSYLEIPRDVLDREIPVGEAVMPKPGHYRASAKSIGDPADTERLADILVDAERSRRRAAPPW